MEAYQKNIKPGCLLISRPEPGDPRFDTSVSLLCEHDENGSFALILNKPTNLYLNVSDFSVSESCDSEAHFPLWMGGPVQMEQCFFIFKSSEPIEEANLISEQLYFSTSQQILKKIVELALPFKIFVGYAGWSFYQLDCEISYGWWLINEAKKDCPFHPNVDQQWLECLKKLDTNLYFKGLDYINPENTDS
jgi:putative transcriptional regulator